MKVYLRKQNFFWPKILMKGAALAVLLVFLNLFQYQVRSTFFQVFAPVSKAFVSTGSGIANISVSFFNIKGLKQENISLIQQNTVLLSQISLLQEFLIKQQALKEALESTKQDASALVLADVTGLDLQHDLISIGRGSRDGIAEHMPVISKEKVLYGRVAKVYGNFSQVALISARQSVVDVKILHQESSAVQESIRQAPIYGAAKGNGNLSLSLDLVDSSAVINENDTLITSGLEGIFPENLLVGTITAKHQNDAKPFQTARINPFFDVKNLDHLFVVTNYMKK